MTVKKKDEMRITEHQNRRNGESCSSPVSIFFNVPIKCCTSKIRQILIFFDQGQIPI